VRLRESERATASDGAGFVAVLRVERVKPEIVMVVESSGEHPRPVAPRAVRRTLGERGDWGREAGELGVTAFQPSTPNARNGPRRALGTTDDRRAPPVAVGMAPGAAARAGIVEAMAAAHERTRWLADPSGPALPDRAPPDEPCGRDRTLGRLPTRAQGAAGRRLRTHPAGAASTTDGDGCHRGGRAWAAAGRPSGDR
jgi:hypothetical protein